MKSRSNMASLQEKLASQEKGGKDTRFWAPTYVDDKSENIIRFMPVPFCDMDKAEKGEIPDTALAPIAIVSKYAFQGPSGKWFIETARATIGMPDEDPVKEYTIPQWKIQKDTNDAALKEKLKAMFPKQEYIVNILVVKDKNKPENEGKVFLYKIPAAIKDKIEKCGVKEFDTDETYDPFCFDEGANLIMNLTREPRMIGTKEVKVPDYKDGDRVKFKRAPLHDGDADKQEAVWKQCHSLYDFVKPDVVKSYDDLKKRFVEVMGIKEQEARTDVNSGKAFTDALESERVSKPEPSIPAKFEPENDFGDDSLAEFEALLQGKA